MTYLNGSWLARLDWPSFVFPPGKSSVKDRRFQMTKSLDQVEDQVSRKQNGAGATYFEHEECARGRKHSCRVISLDWKMSYFQGTVDVYVQDDMCRGRNTDSLCII